MRLSELICSQAIIPELVATDRNGVIRELIQSLADQGVVDPDSVETIARATISRENQGSTGFGKGVAVPHVKHSWTFEPRRGLCSTRSRPGIRRVHVAESSIGSRGALGCDGEDFSESATRKLSPFSPTVGKS